jgi:hypothetical protein
MNETLIKRALIIMPEPLEWILSGRKIWELRNKRTNFRETIALIEKGSQAILGVCQLTDCIGALTVDQFIRNASKMNCKRKELEAQRKRLTRELSKRPLYAWLLSDVKRLSEPIHFKNPPGAVTWTLLPPYISRRISKEL